MPQLKTLKEEARDGLVYFTHHNDHIGTNQWRLFMRTVLKPYSEQLLKQLSPEDRIEVENHLKGLGGFLVRIKD